MRRLVLGLLFLIISWFGFACQQQTPVNKAAIRETILQVLADQVKGWNNGNIQTFMAGYYSSDSLRFASGGEVTYGWQVVYDRYRKRYTDKEIMGTLSFENVDITVLSADAALVFGRWQLQREADAPWGWFTLLFRKTSAGWKIVHDHTSSGGK